MSEKESKPAAETLREAATPSHIIYGVREGRDGSKWLNRAGALFPSQDGKGWEGAMHSQPVNGRIAIRPFGERLEQMKRGGKTQDRDKGGHEK